MINYWTTHKLKKEILKDGGYVGQDGYEKLHEEYRVHTTQEEDYEIMVKKHDKTRKIICWALPLSCLLTGFAFFFAILPALLLAMFINQSMLRSDRDEGNFLVKLGVLNPNNPTYTRICNELKVARLSSFATMFYIGKKGKDLVHDVSDPDKWKRI